MNSSDLADPMIMAIMTSRRTKRANAQPRPQGLLLDDFQNGGSSGDSPGKGWVMWYKISKTLGDFYHVTF